MKQTKLFLSLLMLLVFSIGNVWGETASLTQDEIKKATENSSYKQTSVTSTSGVWSGNMIINTVTGFVQINKNAKNYHLDSPVFKGGVTKIVINTCNNTAKNRAFYIRSNTQTAQPTSGDYGSGAISSPNGSVAIDVTNAPTSFYIYANGAAYISSVVVTYEAAGSTETTASSISIATNPTKVDYNEGEFFDPAGLVLTATMSEGDPQTITYNEETKSKFSFSPQLTTALQPTDNKVTVTFGGKSADIAISVAELARQTYVKVTDASTLAAGDILLLGCKKQGVVSGAFSTSYLSRVSNDVNFAEDGSSVSAVAENEITLGGKEGAWTFSIGGELLGTTGVKTMTKGNKNATNTWTISITNGIANIASTNTTYGSIKYNAQSPRFLNYASGQTAIELYRVIRSTPQISATSNVNIDAVMSDYGYIDVTYTNISDLGLVDEVRIYTDAECKTEAGKNFWLTADFKDNTKSSIEYIAENNTGAERTAYLYLSVYAEDFETIVAEKVIAITQAEGEAPSYTITISQTTGGEIKADKTQAKAGEKVTLSVVSTDEHYHFDGFGGYAGDESLRFEEGVFTMPAENVEVLGDFVKYKEVTIYLDKQFGSVHFEGSTEIALEFYADETPTIVAENTDETKIFVKWIADDDTKVTFTDATNATTTVKLKDEAGSVTLTATYKDVPKAATITLWENGVENATKLNGAVGEMITLPATAGGNCSKSVEFVGWSEEEIEKADAQPTSKFYAPGAEYTPTAENVTLYAVYAKSMRQVLLSEDFSTLKGDLDNSNTKWDGNANFTGNNAYQAGGIVKLGNSSKTGFLTSKETLTITAGNTINVSFDVLGWTNVEGDIKVTVGTDSKTLTYTATKSDNFESKSVDFVLTKDNPTITIATTAKRAFIDNVVVATKGYSDYSTTCAEGIDVAMPTFSVAGGEYAEAQSVEIRCATEGATIYYTTDGTEPTDKSTKYTEAIKVDQSMTIKAIAYVGEDNYSAVATAEYVVLQAQKITITNSDDEEFTEATIYADGEGNALTAYVDYDSKGKVTVSAKDETLVDITTYDQYGTLVVSLVAKGKAGTTTITVNVAKDETYISGSASFVLHVIEHKKTVAMSFAETSYNATLGEEFAAPELTVNPSVTPLIYSSLDEHVAKVDAETGEITLAGMGTTTIMAEYAGDDTYDPATAQYTLNVTDPNADILTVDVMNTSASYGEFTCIGSTTGTHYAGYNMKSSDGYIQIRSSTTKSTYSGIISTISKGFIQSVSIIFAEANTNGIDIYANLTPYTQVSDLYNGGTRGVKLVSLKGQTNETVTFYPVGNYPYIGIRSNSGAAKIKQIAIAWTPTEVVRTGLTEGKFGTICLEKNVTTSLGASFYEIAYREDQNGEPYKVFFDEVTEPEAGVPYIFLAEDEQITVVYGNETATEASNHNGLVGTFTAITDGNAGAAGNMLENNYLVNNNQIRKCGGNCSLPAYRAYIRMEDVPTNVVAPQPGRRRVTLNNAATGTATGWEGISEDSTIAPQQEGIYDVLGRKLESAESGFYIINGKKQVIVK